MLRRIRMGGQEVEMADTPDTYASIWSDLTKVPFTQGYLDAGGIRTRYLSAGSRDKPLLILIHGTGGHAEAYGRNLAAHAEHFWTFSIDLVGHGWSDKPDIGYEIKDYSAHIVEIIKALGRDKAHISGESLGGWVAAHVAHENPDVVDRLVLNTAGGWTFNHDVMERITRLSMEAVRDPSRERIRTRLEFLMFDKNDVNDDLVEVRRRIYSQPGYVGIMERVLCLQVPDIRRRNMFSEQQTGEISAPTLVLWTSHDPTATTDEGRRIADLIPGAKFVVMDGCGHWPQFEDPDEFNKIHIDFLRNR